MGDRLLASQFQSDVFGVLERELERVVDELELELVATLPIWARTLPAVLIAARVVVRSSWGERPAPAPAPHWTDALEFIGPIQGLIVGLCLLVGLSSCVGDELVFQAAPIQLGQGGQGGAAEASSSSAGGGSPSASSGGGQGGQGGQEPCGGPCPDYQSCDWAGEGQCYGCVPDDTADADLQTCQPNAFPISLYCPYDGVAFYPKHADGSGVNCTINNPVEGMPGWSQYCCEPFEGP